MAPPRCARAGVRCELVFDGVDTAAEVRVNGKLAGRTNDMHLRFVFSLQVALPHVAAHGRPTLSVLGESIPGLIYYTRRTQGVRGPC